MRGPKLFDTVIDFVYRLHLALAWFDPQPTFQDLSIHVMNPLLSEGLSADFMLLGLLVS